MSLFQKLEGDSLRRTCESEIQELHQIFVSWFQSTRTKAILSEELTSRLDPNFSHIAPNGSALKGRHSLVSTLDEKYGCYKDRKFRIDIYDVKLIWSTSNQCLCTYEEWQGWQQGTESHQFGRLSTCLLVKQSNRWKWVHVHETWLEEDSPKHPTSQAMTANNNRVDYDNETIMTGPVQPGGPPREITSNGDGEKKPDSPVLLLVSSQSLSRELLQKQSLIEAALKGKTEYDTLDGSDPAKKVERDELFAISGVRGKYPQIFLCKKDGERTYWGDYEDFEEANENGTLLEDLGIATNEDRNGTTGKVAMAAAVGAGAVGTAALVKSARESGDEPEVSPKDFYANKVSPEQPSKSNGKALVAGTGVAAAAAGAATAVALDDSTEEESMEFGPQQDSSEEEEEDDSEESEVLDDDDEYDDDDDDDDGEEGEDENASSPDEEVMSKEEKQFLEASQGILVFEEEEEQPKVLPPPPSKASIKDLETPADASPKRHVSPKLEEYAKPLAWDNALIGVSIAGFDIGTSQGPIADETWYGEVGADLENSSQSISIPRPRRKIVLPEMVFPTAHVALEGHGYWLSWDATDALQEWAQAHRDIPIHSSQANRGVQVFKSKDAKLWAEKRRQIADSGNAPSIFHYDWTFSSPFCGSVEGGHWNELDESGMRTELLTDTSIPILFFDEVVLYEDDLHDNGQVQYAVKMRVMPSCAYVLSRLYVRVDNVVIRVRETRVLVDFFGLKPQIYRDVTWRECKWEDLADHQLPTDVKSWTYEKETKKMHQQIKALPEEVLPGDVFKYAVLHPGAAPIRTETV